MLLMLCVCLCLFPAFNTPHHFTSQINYSAKKEKKKNQRKEELHFTSTKMASHIKLGDKIIKAALKGIKKKKAINF